MGIMGNPAAASIPFVHRQPISLSADAEAGPPTELHNSFASSESWELLVDACKDLVTLQTSPEWNWARRGTKIFNFLFPPGARRRNLAKVCANLTLSAFKTMRGLARTIWPASPNALYAHWIRMHEPSATELIRQRQAPAPGPRISVILPIAGPISRLLLSTVQSVLEQTYRNWELRLIAPLSLEGPLRRAFRQFGHNDSRICLQICSSIWSWESLRNAGLESAGGEYVALLEPDDTLAPFALFELAAAIQRNPNADFLYSDEDCLDRRGRRCDPHFKPDWSPDLLCSSNYVGSLTAFSRNLLQQAGGFRPGFERDGNFDLIVRAAEKANSIIHIARFLYHRRIPDDGKAVGAASNETGRKALEDHLARLDLPAKVMPGPRDAAYRVSYHLTRRPLVSIIIPSHDHVELLSRCVESIQRSDYENYEVLIVENGSTQPETFAYYRQLVHQPSFRLLTWDQRFNYAAVNNHAARQASGEVLLFLNNDIEAMHPNWMEGLLEHALRPEVGAVGAKLYYGDGTIQHAGVVIGADGLPVHVDRGLPRHVRGYRDRLLTVQNLSAVTGACLMMRRGVFEEAGGFDERFAISMNDVDLCFELRRRGYLIVWSPHVELNHWESATRGLDDSLEKKANALAEWTLLRSKWGPLLRQGDPYYKLSPLADAWRESLTNSPRPKKATTKLNDEQQVLAP